MIIFSVARKAARGHALIISEVGCSAYLRGLFPKVLTFTGFRARRLSGSSV